MKNKRFLCIILLGFCMLIISGCKPIVSDEVSYGTNLITFNIDGSDQHAYGNSGLGLDYYNGSIIPMNDSRRFVVCNENLFIIDTVTHDLDAYLTDIEVDDEHKYCGIESVGISYDDRYITFTSERQLHCLDLSSGEYTKLTMGYTDEFPKFGMDDRIYFSRYNTDNDTYMLMSIELDGSDLQSIYEHNEIITTIFPGKSDVNVIYFISSWSNFHKINISTGSAQTLCEFETVLSTTARTNDDRYFSFSGYTWNTKQFLFDTQTNTMQIFFYPEIIDGEYIAKILPDRKEALVRRVDHIARIYLWDIDTNSPIDEYELRRTGAGGLVPMAISPDGMKVAINHGYDW